MTALVDLSDSIPHFNGSNGIPYTPLLNGLAGLIEFPAFIGLSGLPGSERAADARCTPDRCARGGTFVRANEFRSFPFRKSREIKCGNGDGRRNIKGFDVTAEGDSKSSGGLPTDLI